MGIVQGLTEFLPVSSSGHLVIVPYLFGWDDPFINSLAFSVMLHMGTLIALLVYFRADWVRLVPAGFADDPRPLVPGRPGPPPGLAARRRHRSRPPSPGSCSTTSIETSFRADRPRRGHARDRGRHPVARRSPRPAHEGRQRRHLPGRDRDRRRPGARADPGHQPVRHLDLGRPRRRPRPRGSRPVQLPDGDAGHAGCGHLRGPQARWPARPASRSSSLPLLVGLVAALVAGLLAIRLHAQLPAHALARHLRLVTASPSRRSSWSSGCAAARGRPTMEVMKQLRQRAIRDLVEQRPIRTQQELAGGPARARVPHDPGDDLARCRRAGADQGQPRRDRGLRPAAAPDRGRDLRRGPPAEAAVRPAARGPRGGPAARPAHAARLRPRHRRRAGPRPLAGGRRLDRRRRHPLRRVSGPWLAAADQAPPRATSRAATCSAS